MIRNDIEFHYGFRKCGKSERVEQMLSSYKSKIYFGTLPVTSDYIPAINEHVRRRGPHWITLEMSHDFFSDIKLINSCLNDLPADSAGMLDGLWTWYVFTNKRKKIDPVEFSYGICQTLKNKFDVLKIVDIGSYVFAESSPDKKNIEKLHETVIAELGILKLIDYRYEKL